MKIRERKDKPAILFHQIVEKQVIAYPQSNAVIANNTNLTYKELNTKANQLAHYLLSYGIQPGIIVGISMNRSIEMIVAVLALLKTGAAYLPIDPDYPEERIDYMLSNSDVLFLITETGLLTKFKQKQIKKLIVDKLSIESFPRSNPQISVCPEDIAYVLYTSGSMGKPKGVMVTQGNLIHVWKGWKTIYKLKNRDSHLQMASFSFDVFTGDLIRALGFGGRLILCPRNILLFPQKLFNFMSIHKINVAEFVPTVLRKLIEYVEQNKLSLDFMRLLICGSDNWSRNEYSKTAALCSPKTRVINSYGLTETTIDSTYFEEKPKNHKQYVTSRTVPIGKPFPGTEIFLLDEQLKEVKDGSIGEIYIGGNGLARGYLKQPGLTAQKFIKHPFSKSPHARLYKTGDCGCRLVDGNIELIGRIDNQIKLRGMRIELSAIENTLNANPSIRESLVMAYEEENNKCLIAYIVFKQNQALTSQEIVQFLKCKLPNYMIPSYFIPISAIPLTPNGKIDRNALKTCKDSLSENVLAPPKTNLEKKIHKLWAESLKHEKISTEDNFYDLGGDSFSFANLICEIEKIFDLSLSIDQCKNFTITDFAKLIRKKAILSQQTDI